MINERLKNALGEIKTYHKKSTAMQDAAKKQQNDKAFSETVDSMVVSINKISQASKLNFIPEDSVLDSLQETLDNLEETIEYGEVDEDLLSRVSLKTKKTNTELRNEWNGFYKKQMLTQSGKINLVSRLSTDKTSLNIINTQINQAASWDNLHVVASNGKSIFDNYVSSIDSLQQKENDLHLSPGIRFFLSKVNKGSAGINDITPEIIAWIKEQKLEKVFSIKYSSSVD